MLPPHSTHHLRQHLHARRPSATTASGALNRCFSFYSNGTRKLATYSLSVILVFAHLLHGTSSVAAQSSPNPTSSPAFIDLGIDGVAFDINNAGQIVGATDFDEFSESRPWLGLDSSAFLYTDGRVTNLGTLGGLYSQAGGINDLGEIVGGSETDPHSNDKYVFLYKNGGMIGLNIFGVEDSIATGINDAGHIVGFFLSDGTERGEPEVEEDYHAFMYKDGREVDINPVEGLDSYALGINNSGQIVGLMEANDGIGDYYAFLRDSDGRITDINPFGSSESFASGINNLGQIVGAYKQGEDYRAFLYSNGKTTDLGTFGGSVAYALGINDAGQIVGYYKKDGLDRAFLLQPPPPVIVIPGFFHSLPTYYEPGAIFNSFYGEFIESLTESGRYWKYDIGDTTGRLTEGGCDNENQKKNAPNLFVFPYEWSKSNADNTSALHSYVKCVQKFYPNTKVNIVAHSMGGLLARRYILDYGDADVDGYPRHRVDKLITIGTPWLGAPKATLAIETGEFDPILDYFVPNFAVRSIIKNSKGAHELLPSRSYFDFAGSPFGEGGFDVDGSGNGDAPETYDYDKFVRMLDRRYPMSPGSTNRVFHEHAGQDDESVMPNSVRYYQIYGVQNEANTIGEVRAVEYVVCNQKTGTCHSHQTFTVSKKVRGDGTVPRISAARPNHLNASNAVLTRIFGGKQTAGHSEMLDNPEVQNLVSGYLQDPANPSASSSNPVQNFQGAAEPADEPPTAPAYYLQVSGINGITITDAEGNSNTPIEGTPFLRSVPGVTYHALGNDTVLIVVPTDKTYTFKFRNTAATPMFVELTQGTDTVTTQAIRYLDLATTTNTVFMLQTSAQGATDLRYDADDDGTFEAVVTPSASVTGTSAQDTTPPVIAFSKNTTGTAVSIMVEDGGAGVKSLYYSLDGINFLPYTNTLNINPIRTRTVYAFAEDNAANRSSLATFQVRRKGRIPLRGIK